MSVWFWRSRCSNIPYTFNKYETWSSFILNSCTHIWGGEERHLPSLRHCREFTFIILAICTSFWGSVMSGQRRHRSLRQGAMQLFSYWMVYWRVNGSTAREPFLAFISAEQEAGQAANTDCKFSSMSRPGIEPTTYHLFRRLSNRAWKE